MNTRLKYPFSLFIVWHSLFAKGNAIVLLIDENYMTDQTFKILPNILLVLLSADPVYVEGWIHEAFLNKNKPQILPNLQRDLFKNNCTGNQW